MVLRLRLAPVRPESKPNAEDEAAGSKNDPEHWDVIQDEATRETSKSGLPMFGDKFIE